MVSVLIALLAGASPLSTCPPAWEPLPQDACLLKGERRGLALYFHGMSAPSMQALGVELSLMESVPAAQRTAVVVLRGQSGLCDWAPERRGWWCWPTSRSQLAEVKRLTERVREIVEAASARLKRPARAPPVLTGYSNGAYFVGMLMGETEVPAAGWVLMHGGPVTGVAYPRARERPTLLLAAAGDGIQRPAMESLKAKLDQVGWQSTLVVRPGAHPLELEDFQRLFDFTAAVSRP
jgi:predicted esterase